MTKDILDKLNALLHRVQTRAGEPGDDAENDEGDAASSPEDAAPGIDARHAEDRGDDAPELELGDTLVDAELPVDEIEEGDDEMLEERAPRSAPRLAAIEPADEIARAAFDREEPPSGETHTAPPDSGRLPKTSETPLLDEPFDAAEITGVHAAPAAAQVAELAATRDAEPVEIDDAKALARSGEHLAMPRTFPEAERLVPVVSRAPIEGEATVDVIASANRFAPRTIGELLDATLGL